MDIVSCEGTEGFAKGASDWCARRVAEFDAKSLFVPAGETPLPLYELWEREKPAYLEGLRLVQVDDVLTGAKKGLFRAFLEAKLPSFRAQVDFISEAAAGAELALLGLGLNGHVAFHEPGLPSSFRSGCVRLEDATAARIQAECGTWAVTYGAGSFLRTKAALLLVRGASKRNVLRRLLDGERSLPASALLTHPRLTILADLDALPVT